MKKEDRDFLQENAMKGRGLWIGMFDLSKDITTVSHPFSELWPSDPHVTLAHFGRNNTGAKVERICDVLSNYGGTTLIAEVTGFGIFWRREPTVFALVNSAKLFDLRVSLLARIKHAGVEYDDLFGFIPHITFEGVKPSRIFEVGNAKKFQLGLHLGVVCGDHTVIL